MARLRRRYGRAGLHVRPHIMWVEDVIRASGVPRRPEYHTPEWRKRFRLWHDLGETVEGGAEMLRKWPWPKDNVGAVTGPRLRELRDRMYRLTQKKGD